MGKEMRMTQSMVLIALGLSSVSCFEKPMIIGEVSDQFGSRLGGVEVSIVNTVFKTESALSGSYELSYAPGKFDIHYVKAGYVPASIVVESVTAIKYPMRNVTLYKSPPGRGVWIEGSNEFMPIESCNITWEKDSRGIVNVYRLGSDTTTGFIGTGLDYIFIDNLNLGAGSDWHLFRLYEDREFYRVISNGPNIQYRNDEAGLSTLPPNDAALGRRFSANLGVGFYVYTIVERGIPIMGTGSCYSFTVSG
jgi:hypothetical protein